MPHRDSMTTNADGAFHFAPFGPGNATLVARCPNGDQGTHRRHGCSRRGESIVPVKPGGSIEGRVVDTSGKPVAGVMVTAESGDELTMIENGPVVERIQGDHVGGRHLRDRRSRGRRLSAVRARSRPADEAPKTVKLALAAGQHATGVEVVVERPTGTIERHGHRSRRRTDRRRRGSRSARQPRRDCALERSDDEPIVSPHGCVARRAASLRPRMTDARGHFELTSLHWQVSGRRRGAGRQAARARRGCHHGRPDLDSSSRAWARCAAPCTGRMDRPSCSPYSRRPIDARSPPRRVRFPPPTDRRSSSLFTDGAFVFPRLESGDYHRGGIDRRHGQGEGASLRRTRRRPSTSCWWRTGR